MRKCQENGILVGQKCRSISVEHLILVVKNIRKNSSNSRSERLMQIAQVVMQFMHRMHTIKQLNAVSYYTTAYHDHWSIECVNMQLYRYNTQIDPTVGRRTFGVSCQNNFSKYRYDPSRIPWDRIDF